MRSGPRRVVLSRYRGGGGLLWARSVDRVLRLGRHEVCVEHDQPFEVKRHGLQEGCELILSHPTVAHALRPLRKHPFVRSSQMHIPSITIPILRGHVVPLDRRQMTAPLGAVQ
jgi:hypothetical protein